MKMTSVPTSIASLLSEQVSITCAPTRAARLQEAVSIRRVRDKVGKDGKYSEKRLTVVWSETKSDHTPSTQESTIASEVAPHEVGAMDTRSHATGRIRNYWKKISQGAIGGVLAWSAEHFLRGSL
jgi:hypothetical protein